jgi:hypothetical protein
MRLKLAAASRAQIRGACPDRLCAVHVKLAKPRRDAGGLPYVLRRIRKSPSTDRLAACQERCFARVVEVLDVEALGSGIGGGKGKRAGQWIRAAAKVDDDVAGHGAVHCAHDIASLGERAKGRRQSPRIAVVALGRHVVGRLCTRRRVGRSAVGGQDATGQREDRGEQPRPEAPCPKVPGSALHAVVVDHQSHVPEHGTKLPALAWMVALEPVSPAAEAVTVMVPGPVAWTRA